MQSYLLKDCDSLLKLNVAKFQGAIHYNSTRIRKHWQQSVMKGIRKMHHRENCVLQVLFFDEFGCALNRIWGRMVGQHRQTFELMMWISQVRRKIRVLIRHLIRIERLTEKRIRSMVGRISTRFADERTNNQIRCLSINSSGFSEVQT